MFSEMMVPLCEHVSRSHCPCLALAILCLRAPLTVTVEPLQRAFHWAATVAGPILRISPWGQQATVGTSLSHLTSSQDLPQKREACLTQIGMPLCCYSHWSVGSMQQMQLLPDLYPAYPCSAAPVTPGERIRGQRDGISTQGHPHLAHGSYPPYC